MKRIHFVIISLFLFCSWINLNKVSPISIYLKPIASSNDSLEVFVSNLMKEKIIIHNPCLIQNTIIRVLNKESNAFEPLKRRVRWYPKSDSAVIESGEVRKFVFANTLENLFNLEKNTEYILWLEYDNEVILYNTGISVKTEKSIFSNKVDIKMSNK